jgi:hypothetical protein
MLSNPEAPFTSHGSIEDVGNSTAQLLADLLHGLETSTHLRVLQLVDARFREADGFGKLFESLISSFPPQERPKLFIKARHQQRCWREGRFL